MVVDGIQSLQIVRTKTYTSFIHHLKKSIVERAIEYVKDRTENFDDYYPCRKSVVVVDCNIVHVLARFHCSCS